MTTDLSPSSDDGLLIHVHQHESMGRVKTAPEPEIPTSLSAAARIATRRANTLKGSTIGGGSESSSRNKLNRQSIKFSNKSFVTKWAGDLEKDYTMGELLGKSLG
jgi:hypothetical protein